MFVTIANLVAHVTSRKTSPRLRLTFMIIGAVFFLVVVPTVLILAARYLTGRFQTGRRCIMRFVIGIPSALAGLAALAWSAATFWTRGEGTPAPLAAPQRLVTDGPYRWCRNPIQLGATLYFFGIGCIVESFGAGLIMLALVTLFGTAYHRLIEEKELRMRFGEEYEMYRKNTPYIFPCFRNIYHSFFTVKEQGQEL